MSTSKPFGFFWAVLLPVLLAAILLSGAVEPLDFYLANLSYIPGQGFVGDHSWFLENVLHDAMKQVVIGLALLFLIAFLASWRLRRLQPHRRRLGYVVLALALSTGIVTPLKKATGVQCPWSLQGFGGEELFSPLLGERPVAKKPGRCWPGGHAAAGFSLFALFFALRDVRPRLGQLALACALLLGSTFSIGRMLQGAHFLSHNLWTALICWLISLALYRLMLYRAPNLSLRGVSE